MMNARRIQFRDPTALARFIHEVVEDECRVLGVIKFGGFFWKTLDELDINPRLLHPVI